MSNQNNESGQNGFNRAASMSSTDRDVWTEQHIRKYAYGSLAVGLIPVPIIDLVALTGLQLKLIKDLSLFYGVSFSKEKTTNILASLAGASVPLGLTRGVCSMLKIVPFVGYAATALAMSAISGASTYAVGKMFVRHFESGGTFLNFDMTKNKEYYEEQVRKGKAVMEELKKSGRETSAG
jgi:uncharacterized protein (DUF697 family)